DNVYHLNGRVFVEEGAVLHIEAGTVIKGMPGSGEDASALIVARGGKIYAEGTAQRPIIFTAESDDVNNPADISYDTKGLWGGVIILGKAKINRPEGEFNIEGIPSTEPRGVYGGTDDDDNSGVFRYVSIRHGGAEIGEGNEINGLTLGGVGRGTTIDHVEVFANKDDGFEFFGGTVNVKNLIVAFCGDDGIDLDEGYRGKMQYVFVIQHPDFGNRCGEHDGAPKSAITTEPKAYAQIYNATYLGSGMTSSNPDQDELFKLRENWGGIYANSIFGDYNGYGVDVSDKYSPDDAKDRLLAGEIQFKNNIWFNFNKRTLADSIGKQSWIQSYLQNAANGNVDDDPQLMGISRIQNA
ncbi:MAG: T9SS C-terminal target domain-containing protein, partial [Gammaproteobacteria bacterium]